MVCLAVYRPGERLAGGAAEVLARWRPIAATLPAKQRVDHCQPDLQALVIHHGTLRCPGIAVAPDGAAVLAITGSYWLEPDAESLATPQQALARLLSGGRGPQLYGNFSYVLYQRASGNIRAECGGLGAVPLYYTQREGALCVATDVKFLLAQHRSGLSREGAAEFIAFGHLVSDLTLLEGVRRLMPGNRLVAENGNLRLEADALPRFSRDQQPSSQLFDLLDQQFERAIRRYSPDVTSVSVSLSGGMDSRTTLLAALRVGMKAVPWTAGEPGSLECEVARRVAEGERLPIAVHENDGCRMRDWFDQAVWLTEARVPPGHMHFFDAAFSGAVASGGQLHGLIGDVVAGGDYDTRTPVPSEPRALRDFCAERIRPMVYWPTGSWQRLGLNNWIAGDEVRERLVAFVMARCASDDPYSTFLWSRYVHRGFGFIVPALTSQVSPWGDVMTPFTDPAFFTTCATLAHDAIADRRAQLAWSARRYPRLIATPRVKDGVLLPLTAEDAGDYDGAIKRLRRLMQFRYYVSRLSGGRINLHQRESYPFYGLWYRNCRGVREYFDSVLLSERSLDRGLWKREGIESLLHDLRVGRNVWDAIGTILMVESFARLFADGAGLALAERG